MCFVGRILSTAVLYSVQIFLLLRAGRASNLCGQRERERGEHPSRRGGVAL